MNPWLRPSRTCSAEATAIQFLLDRLGPAAKGAAQIGAVVGREFSYQLLIVAAPESIVAAPESEAVIREGTLSAGHGP